MDGSWGRLTSCYLEMTGGRIVGNFYGLVDSFSSIAVIRNTSFTKFRGRAIQTERSNPSVILLDKCNFQDVSSEHWGVVNHYGGSVLINDCTFDGMVSERGAIAAIHGANLTIANSVISNCQSYLGSAFVLDATDAAHLKIRNCSFASMTAMKGGTGASFEDVARVFADVDRFGLLCSRAVCFNHRQYCVQLTSCVWRYIQKHRFTKRMLMLCQG